MEKKRLFQTLDEMNVSDIENGTRLVSVSSNFIAGDTIKAGCKITMGAPLGTVNDLMNDKLIPVLLLVDKKEYFKLTGE